jgi:hypothetical protein
VYGEVIQFASEWIKAKAEIIASFQDTLDRLGEVQAAIAQGADPFSEVTIGDPEDPASKKKLMDHGIKVVSEQKKVAELASKHIGDATGQDTAELESVLTQFDPQTIVVLRAEETVDYDGAIALDTALEQFASGDYSADDGGAGAYE